MPAKSKKQQMAMAIAEKNPTKLYSKNKGMLKMGKNKLSEFASTKRKGLPVKKGMQAKGNPHDDIWTNGTIKNLDHWTPNASNSDIRDEGIKGEQLVSSSRGQIKRELKPDPHSSAKNDPELNADTTDYNQFHSGGKVKMGSGDQLTSSARGVLNRELKPAKSYMGDV